MRGACVRARDRGVPEDCLGLLRKVFAYGFGYAPRRAFVPAGRTGPLGEHEDLQRFRRMERADPPDAPDHLMRVALKVCDDCDMTAEFTIGIDS